MKKKIVRNYNLESMLYRINNRTLTRLSFDQYKVMNKPLLLKHFISFISNYDSIRHKYIELQLENNYLTRKIELQREQLEFYKKKITIRSFKHGIPKQEDE